ncbi:MAG: sugar phosphate nucleotidyltransferase [Gammaproteobacteria bacterium]|nr:sugar phosphate nucleotidyltransferase [Gammaproteobacteria bacterium]
MSQGPHNWALVLAAGEGSRLRSLTTTASGVAVPKQFCSLVGEDSLLQEALRRAAVVARPDRICAIVAEQHREWWSSALADLPADNVVVQPENRGTAHGILLPLLDIVARDPDARVVILPADHHVRDEAILARALREATRLANRDPETVFLLGVEPDQPDPELGYVLPADTWGDGPSPVHRFVEKPPVDEALDLLKRGALWNVFIMAATARALLALFAADFAGTAGKMLLAIARDARGRTTAMRRLYRQLPVRDFSRDVLEGREARLQVLPVPNCGWTDLGTPKRVAETLRWLPRLPRPLDVPATAYPNLAIQHARLLQAGAAVTQGAGL